MHRRSRVSIGTANESIVAARLKSTKQYQESSQPSETMQLLPIPAALSGRVNTPSCGDRCHHPSMGIGYVMTPCALSSIVRTSVDLHMHHKQQSMRSHERTTPCQSDALSSNNLNQIKKIDLYTSHHTHYVIGTGANDPQKMDPNASRETLDHSIMYIFAVALEDADWHHVKSYTKQRANKKSTIKIWKSITTHEDKKWTQKYHDPNPKNKSFGGKVVVTLNNGKKIVEQLDRADAHPYGARPFKRENYINKFLTLTDGILDKKESTRFLKVVQNLKNLKTGELNKLNIQVKKNQIKKNIKQGIF